jgi:hypothetical protein
MYDSLLRLELHKGEFCKRPVIYDFFMVITIVQEKQICNEKTGRIDALRV